MLTAVKKFRFSRSNGNTDGDCSSTGIVKLLLESGADIHDVDNEGKTVLHKACSLYNEKIISLLVQKGANISWMDSRGQTPFDLLQGSCFKAIIREFSKLIFDNSMVSNSSSIDLIREYPTT